MSGLYLHIPFCKQSCSYCDFYFVTQQQHKADFVKVLVQEIESKKDTVFTQEPVHTIYFGGGTPSLLTKQELGDILDAIYKTFQVQAEEITVELNPDDVTALYLADLKSLGVNRVSMGVQSFDENLLRFMNRAHSADEALKCLKLLKLSDINVFTVDLIYGNPGQTLTMLEKDLETLLTFDPPHVSAYSLTIEPRTRLGKQVKLGRLLPAEDDEVAAHFDLVEQHLVEHDIKRYEVSNFAKAGKEALHNANYWTHKNYLGLGPSAHSFWWNEERTGAFRWSNKSDIKAYIKTLATTKPEKEFLDLPALAEERIMLALRTMKGIDLNELKIHYNYVLNSKQKEYLSEKQRQGKVNIGEALSLTSKGLKIADAIVLDILTQS